MKVPRTPEIRMPEFLNNTYRDLRDRRMLLPVLALLVALVAVPIVLSKPAEAPRATPDKRPVAPQAGAAVQPAVLAEDVGIRDYRERLEEFKRGNPFRQQFKIPAITEGGLAGDDSGSGLAGDDSSSTGSSGLGDPNATGATSATGSPTSTEPVEPPEVQTLTRYFEYRIDAKVGRADEELELREGIREFDVLPSVSTPVVAFLGVTPDEQAAFVVSPDADPLAEDDGHCVPDAQSCLFMTLALGESQRFDYATDETSEPERFELKVVDVYRHRLKRDQTPEE